MAGELYQEVLQIGKETTAGIGVAATRKLYGSEISFLKERDSRPRMFATGNRVNQLAHTLGPVMVNGSVKMPMSADELLEMLAITIAPSAAPSTPSGGTNARQFDFTPGNTSPDSATIERHDGARIRRALGVRGDTVTVAGSANGPNDVTFGLMGLDLPTLGSLTSLTERVPTFMEGYETKLFVDAFGGTPGTTQYSGTLINWNVKMANKLGSKFFADNANKTGALIFGPVEITADLTFEAAAAGTLTEFNNWESQTSRLVRLEFGQNAVIDAGTNEVQTLTVSGTVSGGTYIINFRGQQTASLAYNATAAAIQAALEALGAIGSGNVAVTGGALPGTPATITFQGALAGLDVPAVTITSSLTGGGSYLVATPTPGVGYKKAVQLDIPGNWSKVDLNKDDQGTRVYQLSLQYLYDPTNAFGLRWRCFSNRTAVYS